MATLLDERRYNEIFSMLCRQLASAANVKITFYKQLMNSLSGKFG